MSVLVFAENTEGKFKKSIFELVSYGRKIADMTSGNLTVLSIGNVAEPLLADLGRYGADRVLHVSGEQYAQLDNKSYSTAIAQAVEKSGADIVVFAHNNTGKALAPRISAKLKAGLASAAIQAPESIDPFIVTKRIFNGAAFAKIRINSRKRVITLSQNAFGVLESPKDAALESFTPIVEPADHTPQVKEVKKQTGKIILTDAELVVSGGRGMKGPEHWGPIEELAGLLGAATACSRPVSDEGWRPHEEHTGQTGKVIAPSLYIAVGISGAIQHLAGVSSSKCIVAINKDKDAPIFEAANYGIVGDAFQVLPRLIDAVKEYKAGS